MLRTTRLIGTAAALTATLAAFGLPSTAHADEPIIDITIPVTLCGIEISLLGTATGDCPDTATPGPAVDLNLDPILDPLATGGVPDVGGVVNDLVTGDPVVNVDTPILVCGNAVAVGTEATADCPSTPPITPEGSSAIELGTNVTVCGNGVGVLEPGAGSCTSGPDGVNNDVGLPLDLDETLPVNSIVDTAGNLVGTGRTVDLPQIANDLGLGEVVNPNVSVTLCGNGAGVVDSATGACPQAVAPTTTPGSSTTTPGTTTPATTTPATTTPGATTVPSSNTTEPGSAGGAGGGDDGDGSGSGSGSGGGSLPLTGGGFVTLLGIGLALTAGGVTIRRLGRLRTSPTA